MTLIPYRVAAGLATILLLATSAHALENPALDELRGAAGVQELPPVPAAEPTPEPTPPQQPRSFSRSYEELLYNNDGSVTVAAPYFVGPAVTGGRLLPISAKSDLNGVCRLYGLGEFQARSRTRDGGRLADIGEQGWLRSLQAPGQNSDNFRLNTITCGAGPAADKQGPDARDRAEQIRENDDGSFSIIRPFVAGRLGAMIPLSAASDAGGLCKYFGYASFVTIAWNGDTWGSGSKEAYLINAAGRIRAVVADDAARGPGKLLTNVICRR